MARRSVIFLRGSLLRGTTALFLRYIADLSTSRIVLWCYLVWYAAVASRYFDPSPAIWLNAVGISAVIGTALWLGLRNPNADALDFWQVFRLYLTPFCVSSFSALIKGRGFILVFPPSLPVLALAAGACAAFVVVVVLVKGIASRKPG